MNSTTIKPIPGPGALEAVRGLRQDGFLAYIGKMWQTYGDLFQIRLGRRTLIFAIHPEAVRYISITNRQNYDKRGSYDSVRRFIVGDGLVTSTGDLWRRQRRLMSTFFTPRGVQAYSEIMLRQGRQLVERWENLARTGQRVEIGEEMTSVTGKIILNALFSTESEEAIIGMKETVEIMVSFTNARQTELPLPLWLPTRANRKYQAARKRMDNQINALIAQRQAMPEAQWPNDLLTRLMQARDEETGEGMTESLLRDESITLFVAGHETTARTLSAAWYILSSNPEVANKLHAELDEVLGDRYPTVEDLPRLPYTLQVIQEVLRLYPPAPFYARDAVSADTLNGYAILEGGVMMLSPYYTHRHPDFWGNPLQFNPDRWTPEREAAQHPYAYFPFAAGQRICIGNNFALLEAHILLALFAKRFAPRLEAGYRPQWEMKGVLVPVNGLPMRIEAR